MYKPLIAEALIILSFATFLSLSINSVRSDGIALFAKKPYEIYVPCPVQIGEAEEFSFSQVTAKVNRFLFIDARPKEDFSMNHLPGSINIPYDYLIPVSDANLKKLANVKGKKIAVYGDGDQPDSGREMALELSGKGIKNIGYIKGGWSKMQHER